VENLLGVRRKNHWITQTIPLSTITGIHKSSLVSTRGLQLQLSSRNKISWLKSTSTRIKEISHQKEGYFLWAEKRPPDA
jgi:hypothetical protein